MAKRFTSMVRGDWGTLIDLWEKDMDIVADRRRRRHGRVVRGEGEKEELEKRRRQVLTLISTGQISRVMQRVTIHGLASMADPAIRQQGAAKYPPRGHPMPHRVPKFSPVENLRGLRDALKALTPGSSRCSISHLFDYWLQLSYPSVVAPVARWLDSELWKTLETATGLSIPREAEGREWDCVLPVLVLGRRDRSFQEWVVRLSIRLRGFCF
jgi:hypothetical protein